MTSDSSTLYHGDHHGAARRLGNGTHQEGLDVGYGATAELETIGGFGNTLHNRPGVTVIVQWAPPFSTAYQQFICGNMRSIPMARMGNMTGHPIGGMGNYGAM
ncbi:unnamed protein product [Adineta ricciae]|uniref:Uncharacterized protein n=1 Tax=Adineta ricciae TaxID=249248 RepID=A0A815K9P5_ADIRI|nr:unnamed protein product [Adineta ricciae]